MRRDDAWLLDILLSARRVARYLENVPEDAFCQDSVLQDAIVKRLEIIGKQPINLLTRPGKHIPEFLGTSWSACDTA